jgi:hypothetical protein
MEQLRIGLCITPPGKDEAHGIEPQEEIILDMILWIKERISFFQGLGLYVFDWNKKDDEYSFICQRDKDVRMIFVYLSYERGGKRMIKLHAVQYTNIG